MGSARLAQWNCRARQGTTTARWANVAGWAGRQAQSTHSDEFHTEARLAPPVLPDSFAHDPSLFARSLVIDCPSLPPPPRPGTHGYLDRWMEDRRSCGLGPARSGAPRAAEGGHLRGPGWRHGPRNDKTHGRCMATVRRVPAADHLSCGLGCTRTPTSAHLSRRR